MNFIRIHTRAIVWATVFAAVVVTVSIAVQISLDSWTREVVSTNKTLTKVVAEQLNSAAHPLVDSLNAEWVFEQDSLTLDESKSLDERLKLLSDSVFTHVHGIEGGFFIIHLDEFYGYSYPTSPPPIPVYGPPPRSYNFIKSQVLETIDKGEQIVRLHQFDPAIFPLATHPVTVEGKVIGVVWARIHIERELPAIKLRQVINFGAIISLLGFVIALLTSISQRRKIQQMSSDLEQVKSGNARQVTVSKGALGFVGQSVNAMIRTMREENDRREQLERELHQKQKMASLGKVIAGVAHEVKTPLAIIKTRIQIWQQAIRNSKNGKDIKGVFTDDSLQMVVDEVDRLADLVKRLLVFSKPQPGRMEPTDINGLLKHNIMFSETRSTKRSITIQSNFDPTVPPILADRSALGQVFINVISNSIEAVSENGAINVRTEYDKLGSLCRVTIEDDGIGIPEDLQQSLFDPFVTTKEKGFGLGLSISYEIIEGHGGTIQLRPRSNGGTVCIITLPNNQPGRDLPDESK